MVFIHNNPSHNLKSSELLKQQINDFLAQYYQLDLNTIIGVFKD
jgi:hypothetical protein